MIVSNMKKGLKWRANWLLSKANCAEGDTKIRLLKLYNETMRKIVLGGDNDNI